MWTRTDVRAAVVVAGPDGARVLAGGYTVAALFDAATGQTRGTDPGGRLSDYGTQWVAFNADGARVAYYREGDGLPVLRVAESSALTPVFSVVQPAYPAALAATPTGAVYFANEWLSDGTVREYAVYRLDLTRAWEPVPVLASWLS